MPPTPNDERGQALLQLLRLQTEEAVRFTAVFGEAHGLHQTDIGALAAIAQASSAGTPMGPARLAETLHLSPSATTALVDRLAAAGHVIRRPDDQDRRRTILEMQPRASALAAAFFGPLGAAYRAVMEQFSDDDLEVVGRFLREVIDATALTRRSVSAVDAGN